MGIYRRALRKGGGGHRESAGSGLHKRLKEGQGAGFHSVRVPMSPGKVFKEDTSVSGAKKPEAQSLLLGGKREVELTWMPA